MIYRHKTYDLNASFVVLFVYIVNIANLISILFFSL